MKVIVSLIILISIFTLSCSYEGGVAPEDDGIRWEQITGKLTYLKGNILYLLDADSLYLRTLGTANLSNPKWNKTSSQITGLRYLNESTYSLEGIDLNGNRSVIYNSLSTKYYDWLPDGRLVTISVENKILVNESILIDQTFNTLFGLACSPDGKRIVISTDNLFENYLLEIDIKSLDQRIIARNLNLLDPNFLQPIYLLDSDKVVFATLKNGWNITFGPFENYYLWSISGTRLGIGKDPCRSSNLQKFLYTNLYDYSGKKFESIRWILLMEILLS